MIQFKPSGNGEPIVVKYSGNTIQTFIKDSGSFEKVVLMKQWLLVKEWLLPKRLSN